MEFRGALAPRFDSGKTLGFAFALHSRLAISRQTRRFAVARSPRQTKKARSRSSAPHRRQQRGSVSPRHIGRYFCTSMTSPGGLLALTTNCPDGCGVMLSATCEPVDQTQNPAPLPTRGRGCGANNLCRKRTSGERFLAALQSPVTPGRAPADASFLSTSQRCPNLKQSLMALPREPAERWRLHTAVSSRETRQREKSPAKSEAWRRFSLLARRLQLLPRCKQPNCRR
jgi:hypothetical protein